MGWIWYRPYEEMCARLDEAVGDVIEAAGRIDLSDPDEVWDAMALVVKYEEAVAGAARERNKALAHYINLIERGKL